jgi:D-alanyl-D-alanine carboxypeptidase (penicillin-binding protein 5/6)
MFQFAGNFRTAMLRGSMFRLFAFVLFLAGLSFGPILATAEPLTTNAQHVYIADFQTGTVIYDKMGEERLHPASMSKLMTIYLLFEAIKRGDVKLTDTFHVSQRAWAMQGSKMFVDIDSDVKVEDLIRGIVVQSGNDACIVVAEGLAGTEEAFAERMNEKAKELGLKDSHFTNSSGWPDPNHYMTAEDLALLAKRLIVEFPEFYPYFSEHDFTYHGIKQGNRNPLLYRAGSGVDGLKTGHTEEAGFGLTASAIREGRRIIMVAHGLNDMQERADEAGQLLDWAFRETANFKLAAAGAVLGQAPVWYGAATDVPITVATDLIATLPKSARGSIAAKLMVETPVPAPIAKGQPIGTLVIEIANMPRIEAPVVAAANVEGLGVFERLIANVQHILGGG